MKVNDGEMMANDDEFDAEMVHDGEMMAGGRRLRGKR